MSDFQVRAADGHKMILARTGGSLCIAVHFLILWGDRFGPAVAKYMVVLFLFILNTVVDFSSTQLASPSLAMSCMHWIFKSTGSGYFRGGFSFYVKRSFLAHGRPCLQFLIMWPYHSSFSNGEGYCIVADVFRLQCEESHMGFCYVRSVNMPWLLCSSSQPRCSYQLCEVSMISVETAASCPINIPSLRALWPVLYSWFFIQSCQHYSQIWIFCKMRTDPVYPWIHVLCT